MSAEPMPGYAAYDPDACLCTEDYLDVCDICGQPSGEGECEDEPCGLRPATNIEKTEIQPAKNCPQHGWCGGCTSRHCEDCAP